MASSGCGWVSRGLADRGGQFNNCSVMRSPTGSYAPSPPPAPSVVIGFFVYQAQLKQHIQPTIEHAAFVEVGVIPSHNVPEPVPYVLCVPQPPAKTCLLRV